MKILMIMSWPDPNYGGKYYATLAIRLAARSNEVYFAVRPPELSDDHNAAIRIKSLLKELNKKNVRVVLIPGLGIRNPMFWICSLRRLSQFIHNVRPNILHVHGISDTLLAYIASCLNRIKITKDSNKARIVSTFHGVSLHDPIRYRIAARILDRCSDFVFVVSKNGYEKLKKYGLKKLEKVIVLPNGVDIDYFDSGKYGFHLELLAWKNNKNCLVGIIGRLSPEKGHSVFLNSAAKVHMIIPEAKFVIVGDGVLKCELKKMARQLGLEGRVLFMGSCSPKDIALILKTLEIVVLTSNAEACPLTILEAMAMQKPVIATNVGDIPEMVLDGVTGFIVPPSDICGLSSKIVQLLQDNELRDKMGACARRHVEQTYAIDSIISRIESRYIVITEPKRQDNN